MITDPEAETNRADAGAFADLDTYAGLPRLGGLWLSPDGRRIVVGAALPDHTQARYATALWEVDPDGARPARRLTRSARGESEAAFTPEGDLLFVSARQAPDGPADEADPPTPALWSLPAGGGDAHVVADPPGGVRGVVVAAGAGTVAFGSALLPSATDPAHDRELRARRTDAHVTAILHESYPVRFWDHDLGPAATRLLVTKPDPAAPRDLTGHVDGALHDDSTWEITPDGRTVVAEWVVQEPGGSRRATVVAIDVAGGGRRALADDPDHEYEQPRLSPDGTRVAVLVTRRPGPHDPGGRWLGVVPVAGGEVEPLTAAWDRWPHSARWTPDGAALVVAADDRGHSPLWRVDAGTGAPTRLTDDGAYTDPRPSPDGRWVYALRSAVDHPPAPVRVALDGTRAVTALPGPAEALGLAAPVPGRLTEVTATAADGTPLRAWLALPAADAPAPLLLWLHGGPLGSWNAWSWRWNPWLAVARGYAVLLPDPAMSTGYGIDFIRRGWGDWGGAPYTDAMALTDAALARPDLDEDRTAAMGGSYGGYLANWVAGHTDRFLAIVTHASCWALDQLMSTTDAAFYWQRELTAEMVDASSPHHHAEAITTPMLVIHGALDHRVPIGEGLRLWWDLASRSTQDAHRFLYFPDEGHWVLTPNHAKLWYATVFAFLAQHVLGEEWVRPELLG